MTKWFRLYLTVEGQTEKEFADRVLKPHLADYAIDVRPRVAVTNRKLGQRGGSFSYERIKADLGRLMKQDSDKETRFTTMLDLYALPAEFPGWGEARKKTRPLERVTTLEKALETELADPRFLPFIQLHEFEALLFCDLGELEQRIFDSEAGVQALRKEVVNLAPEEIDEGAATAPSKRIIRHVPAYETSKVRVGASAAAAIGLNILRARCPHFGSWISRLEALGNPIRPI